MTAERSSSTRQAAPVTVLSEAHTKGGISSSHLLTAIGMRLHSKESQRLPTESQSKVFGKPRWTDTSADILTIKSTTGVLTTLAFRWDELGQIDKRGQLVAEKPTSGATRIDRVKRFLRPFHTDRFSLGWSGAHRLAYDMQKKLHVSSDDIVAAFAWQAARIDPALPQELVEGVGTFTTVGVTESRDGSNEKKGTIFFYHEGSQKIIRMTLDKPEATAVDVENARALVNHAEIRTLLQTEPQAVSINLQTLSVTEVGLDTGKIKVKITIGQGTPVDIEAVKVGERILPIEEGMLSLAEEIVSKFEPWRQERKQKLRDRLGKEPLFGLLRNESSAESIAKGDRDAEISALIALSMILQANRNRQQGMLHKEDQLLQTIYQDTTLEAETIDFGRFFANPWILAVGTLIHKAWVDRNGPVIDAAMHRASYINEITKLPFQEMLHLATGDSTKMDEIIAEIKQRAQHSVDQQDGKVHDAETILKKDDAGIRIDIEQFTQESILADLVFITLAMQTLTHTR